MEKTKLNVLASRSMPDIRVSLIVAKIITLTQDITANEMKRRREIP